MAQGELLEMLASETDRRSATIIAGVEDLARTGSSNPELVEELRVEAHGLKGAAMVVGQARLAELAERIEAALVSRRDDGGIDMGLASRLVAACSALLEGARAAAEGLGEPATVGESLAALAG